MDTICTKRFINIFLGLIKYMSCELSIIIPAFNEQRTIERTLLRYHYFFKDKCNFNIIVVMDGCNDHTFEIVKKLSKEYHEIQYITHPKKLGKGGGIIKGFKSARADYIAFTDADGSTSPKELYNLIRHSKNADVVIGSRWMHDSEIIKKESVTRRLASRSFNLMVRLLFNLQFKDTQCGAKVLKQYVVKDIIDDLIITNFAFDIDLLYQIQRNGYTILELPIEWQHDNFTELRMAKVVPSMFLSILGLRMKYTPFWELIPKQIPKTIFNKVKTI
jgi:glycosyltransferase involved in cell wall biosynthesis